MSTEAKKFRVGVFSIGALVIGVGGLIWIGASRFFEDTVPFVTYFSESVQGLDPGSSVKYRGVPAGRVAKIRIAPALADARSPECHVFTSDRHGKPHGLLPH